MLSVNCPNCNATNKFERDAIPTFCSFCGACLPDMKPYVQEAVRIALEREREAARIESEYKRHEMRMESEKQEIRKEKVRTFKDKVELVRLIGIILLISLTFGFMFYVLNLGH